MYLRKHLTNGKLLEIKQKGFDRITEIIIKQHEEIFILISEFFPKGNFLIMDKDHKILQCLESQEWSNRILKQGETYKSPPETQNPFELDEKQFIQKIKTSEKESIVKTLAIVLSFGGEYAETILALSNIDKSKKSLTLSELKQLYKTIQDIKKTQPTKIEKQVKLENKESQIAKQKQKEIESLNNILETQKLKLVELEKDAETERKKGDLLYENYEATETTLKEKKTEIILNNTKIKLDPKRSLAENAALYYEVSKKAKRKLEGAQIAFYDTQNKIKDLEHKIIEIKEKEIKQSQEEKQKRKLEWYEKYHWFYSSDNFLCIGGRDAVSNEIIIKKHTEKNDLVFHTEYPGSPFFIIKNPDNKQIPQTTIEEAAQATAAYSSVWKTNLSTADVFCVKPEQLTKEFGVQKGMFIIRGEKKLLKPSLKLAIANLNNQIIAGPINAIKSHSTNFLTIIQGDLTKNELAKKLYSKIKGNVEEIERMLPNGKSKIEK